jgi:hypothetical protein
MLTTGLCKHSQHSLEQSEHILLAKCENPAHFRIVCSNSVHVDGGAFTLTIFAQVTQLMYLLCILFTCPFYILEENFPASLCTHLQFTCLSK